MTNKFYCKENDDIRNIVAAVDIKLKFSGFKNICFLYLWRQGRQDERTKSFQIIGNLYRNFQLNGIV